MMALLVTLIWALVEYIKAQMEISRLDDATYNELEEFGGNPVEH